MPNKGHRTEVVILNFTTELTKYVALIYDSYFIGSFRYRLILLGFNLVRKSLAIQSLYY